MSILSTLSSLFSSKEKEKEVVATGDDDDIVDDFDFACWDDANDRVLNVVVDPHEFDDVVTAVIDGVRGRGLFPRRPNTSVLSVGNVVADAREGDKKIAAIVVDNGGADPEDIVALVKDVDMDLIIVSSAPSDVDGVNNVRLRPRG